MRRASGMPATINYQREGEGPPLVLLHGVGHHWQGWQPVIRLLTAEFDVIACDSPGFGASSPLPPGVRPTINAYMDAFRDFFGELELGRPHIAGNSMGGAIALELARAGAVSSVCALSPAGFWSGRERRFCQLSLEAFMKLPAAVRPAIEALARTRAGRIILFAQLYGWPARMPAEEAVSTLRDAWAAPGFAATLDALGEYSFGAGEELREVAVTVAWGAHDHLLPYARQAPRARAMLPRARHLTLGAGHVPYFDDPAAVAEVVRTSTRLPTHSSDKAAYSASLTCSPQEASVPSASAS
jgi:pimeloyl-ACP methyl ester carboxylesterase